jgi:lipopolysaccharide transport system permease protein
VPLFLGLGVTLALSFGMLAAALNVRFRDVKFALPFALQLWMFASPVFYPTGILSEKGKFLLMLNPLTGILEGFRTALFGGDFNWLATAFSLAATVILFLFSLYVFRQMEDDFADLI